MDLESVKPFHNMLKAGAVWLAGRGLTFAAIAVATTSFGMSAAWVPFIVLPMIAAVSAVNTQFMHAHNEEMLTHHYRDEIASVLHIKPSKVGIEQLYTVAYGNKAAGIPANPVLKHALERNDIDRMSSLVTHGASALLSISLASNILGDGSQINGAINKVAGDIMPKLGVGMMAGALDFVVHSVLDFAASHVTGLNRPSVEERITDIRNEVGRGFNVSPERVFSLYVQADERLANDIQQTFHQPYDTLPSHMQERIVDMYDRNFSVKEKTRYINERRMSASELAFTVEGQASGIPLTAPRPIETPFAFFKADILHPSLGAATTATAPSAHHIPDVSTAAISTPVTEHVTAMQAQHHEKSFVERHALKPHLDLQASFADKEKLRENLADMTVQGRS